MISASQVREGLALLGWTTPTLATAALVTFGEAVAAQDDVAIHGLGGLQLSLIRMALDTAGVEFPGQSGTGVRLREALLSSVE